MSSIQAQAKHEGVALRRGDPIWWMTGVVLLAAFCVQLPFALNHDAAWILTGAGRLLDGGRFGADVADVNPPLAWWLSMPAVLLARSTGLSIALAFTGYVLGLGLVSLVLCWRLMRQANLSSAQSRVVLIVIAMVIWIYPAYDFGQREHLMAILALPYIVLAGLRSNGRAAGLFVVIASGALAAVGFCLKPYFFAIPLAVVGFVALETKSWRSVWTVENAIVAVVPVLYVVVVYRFAPDYISTIVPEAAASYRAYAEPLHKVMSSYMFVVLPAVLALAFLAKRYGGAELDAYCRVCAIAGGGALVAATIQQKGWQYHAMPSVGFLVAGCGFALGRWFDGNARRWRKGIVIAVLLMTIALTGPVRMQLADYLDANGNRQTTGKLSDMLRATGRQTSVFAFISSPRSVHPAVLDARARWTGKACCVYLLPAYIKDTRQAGAETATKAARRAAALNQVSAILDALARELPDVILIDNGTPKLGFGDVQFDYLVWLRGRSGFEQVWRHYKEVERVGHFRVFARRD